MTKSNALYCIEKHCCVKFEIKVRFENSSAKVLNAY
jgi:hypothetical protein